MQLLILRERVREGGRREEGREEEKGRARKRRRERVGENEWKG